MTATFFSRSMPWSSLTKFLSLRVSRAQPHIANGPCSCLQKVLGKQLYVHEKCSAIIKEVMAANVWASQRRGDTVGFYYSHCLL
jgi:hypothetical protein